MSQEGAAGSTSTLAKCLYASAALGGGACLFVGVRRYQRVFQARGRLKELLAAAAGEDARVVLTGANSGIGKELAHQLLLHPNVSLLLGCRDMKQAEHIFGKHKERAAVHRLDLLNPDSVQAFADEAHIFLKGGQPGLRMLVNNAGVMRPPQTGNPGGADATWQTNFLGPYLLTELLARLRLGEKGPAAKAPGLVEPVRVVQVSSRLERRSQLDSDLLEAVGRGEAGSHSYADSKRALMLWTSIRAQSLAFQGNLFCHAATPGMVDTQLGRYSMSPWLWPFTKPIRWALLRSPAEGALAVAAAGLTSKATTCFGRYFDAETQLEDLVMERMGEKKLATQVVSWATKASALEQRAAGYDR